MPDCENTLQNTRKCAQTSLTAYSLFSRQLPISFYRIILAQGSHHELAIYSIISKGAINLNDMDPIGYLPLDKPSLAVYAMKNCNTVSPHWPHPHAPGASNETPHWVDWEEMKAFGCNWALAAPMACSSPYCERLLGAVLVAGNNTTTPTSPAGASFSINPEWLKDWSCELAQGIAHASVAVMESSLEMLRLLYPPKVVEALVYNAIAPGSSAPEEAERLAELLNAVVDARNAEDDAVAEAAADFSLSGPMTAPGNDDGMDLSEEAQLPNSEAQESSSPTTKKIKTIKSVNVRNLPSPAHHNYPTTATSTAGGSQTRRFSPVQHSPFAAISATTPFSPTIPGRTTSGGGSAPPTTTGNTSERTSTDSFEDRGDSHGGGRSSSRRLSSPSHMAAAVLRQASLQSGPSILNSMEDLASMSPANSEVEGYEDILNEDATARLMRRPSYQIDRSYSYESMESGGGGGGNGGASSPRVAVVLVHSQEQQPEQQPEQQQQLGGQAGGEVEEEARSTSPRIAVIFPAPYATDGFQSNIPSQDIGATSGRGSRGTSPDGRNADGYLNGGTDVTTAVHSQHRTFYEHQTAYSHNQQNYPQPHQQHQDQHPHAHSLSTISEGERSGRSSQPGPMSSRSLSSQLNSFPSNNISSPLISSSPASSLRWDQEWDLAFTDARLEDKFKDHVVAKLVFMEAVVGGVFVALCTAYFATHPLFSLKYLITLDSGGLFPLILLLTVPLFILLGAREAYTQHRLFVLPVLRLLAAMASGTWLSSLGFESLQAVPLAVLALTNPVRLRFHIPLQLFCMWATIQPGVTAFLVAFLLPTAVVYVVEERLRRQFKLDSLAASAAAAISAPAAAAARSGSGSVGPASPGAVPAAGISSK